MQGDAGVVMSGEEVPRYRGTLAVLAVLFFMWGFCSCLNDVLIPHLKSIFDMNYSKTMLIQFCFFLGYLTLSLPAAQMNERIGPKASIIAGLLVMACGALLFVPASSLASYPLFLAALFVLAGGVTLLQVAANPYVAVLGPEATAPIRLNVVQAFNALGTVLAPPLGGLLILGNSASSSAAAASVLTAEQRLRDAHAVQVPYVGIAIVLIAMAAAFANARLPRSAAAKKSTEVHGSLLAHHQFVLGVLAIFLYVGAEIAIGSFMIGFLCSPHIGSMTAADAAGYLTFYWGGAMVGRFVGPLVMQRTRPALLLLVNSLAAASAVVLSMAASGSLAMWAILAVGLCNSIMFPTIFALALRDLGPLSERASGWLVMACCGGGALPLLQGEFADHFGLTASFVIPALCYLYILGFARASLSTTRLTAKA